jgi:hypothetical protein
VQTAEDTQPVAALQLPPDLDFIQAEQQEVIVIMALAAEVPVVREATQLAAHRAQGEQELLHPLLAPRCITAEEAAAAHEAVMVLEQAATAEEEMVEMEIIKQPLAMAAQESAAAAAALEDLTTEEITLELQDRALLGL